MKIRDLVDQMEKMKGKVVVENNVKDLCYQTEKLTERLNDVVSTNEKISSELLIVKNVNFNLEKSITALEMLQAKAEQYNRMNHVEISGISIDVLDNDLEEKVIEICKDSDIVITSSDIEGCHSLPLGRNSTRDNNRVIVKFVKRKHSELMLSLKKSISSKSKVYINNSLCLYYRVLWGKCEELQRKGKVNQVFYPRAAVTVRVTQYLLSLGG